MTARLVITSPVPMRGTSVVLSGERMIIGRGDTSDLRIHDPFVSHSHAVVVRQGPRMLLEDLGSSNGTSVNGQTVRGPRALRHGDVIGFGRVEIRYEETNQERWDGTQLFEPVRDQDPAANYRIDNQQAQVLNNVGRDQYFQHVVHQRDGFLREIAATKTKASRLIWTGVALLVVGIAAYYSMVIGFMSDVSEGISDPTSIDMADPFGPTVGGVPLGLLGWAAAALGVLLIVIGIVLHVVATARRRRVDASHPLPGAYPARHPR
jgi:FHA domain-containing protein